MGSAPTERKIAISGHVAGPTLISAEPRLIEFNDEVKWITTLFGVYIGVVAIITSLFGTYYAVSTPLQPWVGAVTILVEGLVGSRAARMFGGTRNFTGKLLTFFALALFAQAASWIAWPFFAAGAIPGGPALIALGVGSLTGLGLSTFALLISARTIIDKLRKKEWTLILVSLGLSLSFSTLSAAYARSPAELVVWSGLWPILIFMQLASALVLVFALGAWYVAKPIAIIAFGYVGYSIVTPILTILFFVLAVPAATYWVLISVTAATSFYIVGLGMSQARPRELEVLVERSSLSR